jgi:diguanylate cyclase (GGDEF)-like protein
VVVGAIARQPAGLAVVFIPNAISIALAMTIALLRRRAGFMPASFLAFGLIGTLFFFVGRPFRDFTGIESPFLDRWTFQFVSVFDYLIFSLGIAYRVRFAHREHELMKAELRDASLAAEQDPLTGLLNRRGLDEWMNAFKHLVGTVLFIDIDGIKAVNDEGGHAAGDDTLTVVARIIRHSVRAQDAVARFGGDEFVVVLADCRDAVLTEYIVSRISSAVGSIRPLGEQSDTRIDVSIGSALLDERAPFFEALKHADADAYRVKAEHHARIRQVRRLTKAALPGT